MRHYPAFLLIAILIIISILVNVYSAEIYSPNDIEWDTAVSGTLYKGGTLSNGNYTVKATQFTSPVQGIKDLNGNIVPEVDVDPMVFLEIYKDGSLIKEIVMSLQSEPYISPDYEIKISATGFMAKNAKEWVFEVYNPWGSISMQLRAKPKIEVTVTTDKSVYTSYNEQILTATVEVKNSGNAFAKNVYASLNTGDLVLRGGGSNQLNQYYYRLDKGAAQSYSVILIVPQLIDEKSYSLSADAKGQDVKELDYKAATGTASITVSPKQNYFTISKAVKDRIYLKDLALVTVSVGNGGIYNIYNIHVSDSINENFELKSNATLQWDIPVLKPGEEKVFAPYTVKAMQASPSGFIMPAATAQFIVNNKQYSASSKTTTVVVNGPKLNLNKTVDKSIVNISDDVTVTVSINNVGNIGSKITVKDSLPDSVSLVSGITSMDNFSEPNIPLGFSYIIRMNQEGEVELPAVVANYTNVEYRGTTREVVSSDRPIIKVVDPSKITPTPTPAETSANSNSEQGGQASLQGGSSSSENNPDPMPTPITPGFNLVIAITALGLISLFRRR